MARRAMSFVDETEMVAEDVAKWAAEMVTTAIKSLAPDGRGWQEKNLTEREQLALYMKNLRGNPEAWAQWIDERVKKILSKLQEAGVPEDIALGVHPYSIVQSQAINYSYRMEQALKREQGRLFESLNAPRAEAPSADMLPTGTGGY